MLSLFGKMFIKSIEVKQSCVSSRHSNQHTAAQPVRSDFVASSMEFGTLLQLLRKLVEMVVLALGLTASAFLIYLEEILFWILPTRAKSLRGEVILITGSAGGLGQELCFQLATSGAKLVIWDLSSTANHEVAQHLRKLGAEHVFEDTVDITNRDDIARAAERVRSQVGSVSILINNAGVAVVGRFLDLKPSDVRKTFEVNALSHFWTIMEFLPEMMVRKRGHIVTVASTMSQISMRGSAPYYASKHSIHGMIESLKDELRCDGYNNVKFTTAFPFFFRSKLIDDSHLHLIFRFPSITPQFLDASFVAKRIVEGIRRESEFIYIPRQFWIISMLYRLLPTKLNYARADILVEDCLITPQAARYHTKTQSTSVSPVFDVKPNSFLIPNENIPLDFRKMR